MGVLGDGIYVSAAVTTAVWFAHGEPYVLRLQLAPGTRILQLDGRYDRKVIDSLRREFGNDLLSSDFDKAIPRNKHLRRVELINLANYLWDQECSKRQLGVFYDSLRNIRRYMAKSQYHGIGNLDSDIGVILHNSSRLAMDSVSRYCGRQKQLTEAAPALMLAQAASEFADWVQGMQRGVEEFSRKQCVMNGEERAFEIGYLNAHIRVLPG